MLEEVVTTLEQGVDLIVEVKMKLEENQWVALS